MLSSERLYLNLNPFLVYICTFVTRTYFEISIITLSFNNENNYNKRYWLIRLTSKDTILDYLINLILDRPRYAGSLITYYNTHFTECQNSISLHIDRHQVTDRSIHFLIILSCACWKKKIVWVRIRSIIERIVTFWKCRLPTDEVSMKTPIYPRRIRIISKLYTRY